MLGGSAHRNAQAYCNQTHKRVKRLVASRCLNLGNETVVFLEWVESFGHKNALHLQKLEHKLCSNSHSLHLLPIAAHSLLQSTSASLKRTGLLHIDVLNFGNKAFPARIKDFERHLDGIPVGRSFSTSLYKMVDCRFVACRDAQALYTYFVMPEQHPLLLHIEGPSFGSEVFASQKVSFDCKNILCSNMLKA